MLEPTQPAQNHNPAMQQIKTQLKRIGLHDLMIYLRFNSGQLLLLSTHQSLMAMGIEEKTSLMTADFSLQLLTDRYQFLDAATITRHHVTERLLKSRVGLYRPYCFLRSGVECDFMVSALTHRSVSDGSAIYEKTISKVERIAMALLQAQKSLIFDTMPSYRQAIIFNNLHMLAHVLQRTTGHSVLSHREKDCLTLSLMGKTAQDIAIQWAVSESAVRSHYANIRDKLGCYTLLEATVMAFYIGEIGCLSAS